MNMETATVAVAQALDAVVAAAEAIVAVDTGYGPRPSLGAVSLLSGRRVWVLTTFLFPEALSECETIPVTEALEHTLDAVDGVYSSQDEAVFAARTMIERAFVTADTKPVLEWEEIHAPRALGDDPIVHLSCGLKDDAEAARCYARVSPWRIR